MQPYHSLLSRLSSQHETIEVVIAGIRDERMHYHPQPGKWSIQDNIAHLAKFQPVFIERINTILTTDHPSFERYNAENDPQFESWRSWTIPTLIEKIKTDRQELYKLITRLPEKELNKIGRHLKYGDLNILQWTEFFLLHEAHHMFTIFQLANDTVIEI